MINILIHFIYVPLLLKSCQLSLPFRTCIKNEYAIYLVNEKIYTKQAVIHEHVNTVIIHVVLNAIMAPIIQKCGKLISTQNAQ